MGEIWRKMQAKTAFLFLLRSQRPSRVPARQNEHEQQQPERGVAAPARPQPQRGVPRLQAELQGRGRHQRRQEEGWGRPRRRGLRGDQRGCAEGAGKKEKNLVTPGSP